MTSCRVTLDHDHGFRSHCVTLRQCHRELSVTLGLIYLEMRHALVLVHLTGGIPYDGWSEGMVVAEVTKGYQMPKPDHVDNKL